MIPLTQPTVPLYETVAAINRVIQSRYLTEGAITRQFEEAISKYIGAKYAIAVPNATIGLEIALRAAHVGVEDKVMIPAFTHPATMLAVQNTGAIPVLIDVTEPTGIIDYNKAITYVKDHQDVKALIPVSLFGHPIRWDKLNELRPGITMIEDAACGLGSAFAGIRTGCLADMTVFSFHPRKILTTGEGGMITTDNPIYADYIEAYKNFGGGGEYGYFGTNAKMSDIQAAIGLAQMGKLDTNIQKRREFAHSYNDAFGEVGGIIFSTERIGDFHTYQTYCILVHNRDKIKTQLLGEGIEAQVGSYDLYERSQAGKGIVSGFLPRAWIMGRRSLALPLYPDMGREVQDKVINTLLDAVRGESI